MKYVIIGNSVAAAGCIEGIRKSDAEGIITVISSENRFMYSRPLISYLLCGKTDEERMKYRKSDFYEKNVCETLFGVKAEKIDPENKTVSLSDGKTVGYDKLLIATGSRPFVPPTPGLESVKESFTFMSLDDAEALDKVLSPEKRVLIIGAGLIGLKCAEGIYGRVKEITVVDMADRILPSILDAESSDIVRPELEKKGIKFILGDCVSEYKENTAYLKSGKTEKFDILVTAVGVRANTSLASDCGIKVNRGILVDKFCKTSIPDVYAAGDCSEGYDCVSGENRVLALLPNAYMQGFTAGRNMVCGDTVEYDTGMAMNAIGFFGVHILTAGSYAGDVYDDGKGASVKKLFVNNDKLVGFILIGDVARAGIYTALIREKTPLSSIDFELVRKKPQLMAFDSYDRAHKLNGERSF